MHRYSVTELQKKPSLIREMGIGEIVDRRSHKSLGYFIASKYEPYIHQALERIEREEKMAKLERLKAHQDLEFCETGVDDGLV